MKRVTLASALAFGFALCFIGCEGDAEKINGADITGKKPEGAPTQQGKNTGTMKEKPAGGMPGQGAPGGEAPGGMPPGEAAGKTSAAFPAQSGPIRPDQIPSDYPRPDGEAKLKDGSVNKVEGREGAPTTDAPKEGDAPKTALTDEEKANIAKLPEADQALALAQGVCLISGESLGSMGTPLKVEHEGAVGFLCCKGCKAEFEKDPAKALAKVAK